jgi:hypothetical protein
MITNNWTETVSRREAGSNAAGWRLFRSQLSTDGTRRVQGSSWPRTDWLSRIRERRVLRDRLQAYVSR